ncbi:hypothetical protein FM104_06370 [Microbacterium esteraromaticum]|uniref:Uncharacterized protein n=1 Tax=Microbacterium esteraromaticum TaxID=57043 RepID=A0A1R4JBN4_9MICO|nr:hypothetical protein FM104_06370 [Microbacterium esteraromaticum]
MKRAVFVGVGSGSGVQADSIPSMRPAAAIAAPVRALAVIIVTPTR